MSSTAASKKDVSGSVLLAMPLLTYVDDKLETAQAGLATAPAGWQAGTKISIVTFLTASVAAFAEYGALLPTQLLTLLRTWGRPRLEPLASAPRVS